MGEVTVGEGPGVQNKISLDYKGLYRPRGQQDRCLLEIFVEDHKVRDDALWRLNRMWKHQEVMFLSDIATAVGGKVDCY